MKSKCRIWLNPSWQNLEFEKYRHMDRHGSTMSCDFEKYAKYQFVLVGNPVIARKESPATSNCIIAFTDEFAVLTTKQSRESPIFEFFFFFMELLGLPRRIYSRARSAKPSTA